MKALIRKELRFTAQPISYLFLAFSLMTLLPGYPILVGTFFLGLGLFQSFLAARGSRTTSSTPCCCPSGSGTR